MGAERRRASRVPINVTLSLNGISDENDACEQKDISVETVDISKGGIAFSWTCFGWGLHGPLPLPATR